MTFSFTGLPPPHPIGVRLEAMAQKLLQLLEDRVAQSTWLASEEFTAGDLLNVFGVTAMRLFWSFGLEKYPAILAWLKRVGEREAYRTAIEKGDPGFTPLLGAEAPRVEIRTVSKFFLKVSLNFLGFVHYKDFQCSWQRHAWFRAAFYVFMRWG
jgi:hypothetical protein